MTTIIRSGITINGTIKTGYKIIDNCKTCGVSYTVIKLNQVYCSPSCRPKTSGGNAARTRRRAEPFSFIGIDGEGITHADGSHDYVLLSVGDQSLHRDGARLTFHDIMKFLWDCYLDNPEACFVGYYLKYDFTHWFRDLPQERAEMLFTKAGIAARKPKIDNGNPFPFPVEYDGWQFDLLGMKRLRLRRHVSGQAHNSGYMHICDAGSFFQQSFIRSIDPRAWPKPVCTDQEFETIREGKQFRASASFDPSMINYNITENAVMSKLMETLDSGIRAMDIRLRKDQFFGPGQIASKWLSKIKAPVSSARDRELELALRASYYGGRFEIAMHGPVGTLYEYDINSAYPDVTRALPDATGTWVSFSRAAWRGKKKGAALRAARHTLLHITYQCTDPWLGGLPHRHAKGKRIDYPLQGKGWYWLDEIEAARSALRDFSYNVIEGWAYFTATDDRPFAGVEDLYDMRLQVGKNTPQGKSCKLAYNSLYGKFAQSVGTPKFANAMYASLITSGCRTRILNAIATHPEKSAAVAMIATDGIYFTSPHSGLHIDGSKLGAWDYQIKDDMTLFMPGFYYWAKSGLKSRGCSAAGFAEIREGLERAWRDALSRRGLIRDWPSFSVPQLFGFVSPALALARNKWDRCGALELIDKNFSADPKNKRCDAMVIDGIIRSRPYLGNMLDESTPYDRTFGVELEDDKNEDYAMPDAPDVMQILRENLMEIE